MRVERLCAGDGEEEWVGPLDDCEDFDFYSERDGSHRRISAKESPYLI